MPIAFPGRAKTTSQFIPGRPYSFVAVLEVGATSLTQILDAVRLGPTPRLLPANPTVGPGHFEGPSLSGWQRQEATTTKGHRD